MDVLFLLETTTKKDCLGVSHSVNTRTRFPAFAGIAPRLEPAAAAGRVDQPPGAASKRVRISTDDELTYKDPFLLDKLTAQRFTKARCSYIDG